MPHAERSLEDVGVKSDAVRQLEQDYDIVTVGDLCRSGERLPSLFNRTSEHPSWGLARELAAHAPNPHRMNPSDPVQSLLQTAMTLFPRAVKVHRDGGEIQQVKASDDAVGEMQGALILLARAEHAIDDLGDPVGNAERLYVASDVSPPQFLLVAGDEPTHTYTGDDEEVTYVNKQFLQTVAYLLSIQSLPLLDRTDASLRVLDDGAVTLSMAGLPVKAFIAPIRPDVSTPTPFDCVSGSYTRLF